MPARSRRSRRIAAVCRLTAFLLISLLGAIWASLAQTFEVVRSFVPAPNGRNPRGGLIQANDGSFYGTTYTGVGSDRGTVFRMDTAGALTTLHSFTGGFRYTAKDNCDANPAMNISVTSDEPVVSTPDGAFKADAAGKITGLRLRAERKEDGDGRVYLIKVTATDRAGNSASTCSVVAVPHDQSAASRFRSAAQAAAAAAACKPLANNALAGASPDSKGK